MSAVRRVSLRGFAIVLSLVGLSCGGRGVNDGSEGATAEATEEAIYNAIFKATTVTSSRGTREAVPIEDLVRILEKYNALNWDKTLPPGKE